MDSEYEEVHYKDLKVGNRIKLTYHNNLMCIPQKVRDCVVVEVDGFVRVRLDGEEQFEILLQPGNPERCERYYRKA